MGGDFPSIQNWRGKPKISENFQNQRLRQERSWQSRLSKSTRSLREMVCEAEAGSMCKNQKRTNRIIAKKQFSLLLCENHCKNPGTSDLKVTQDDLLHRHAKSGRTCKDFTFAMIICGRGGAFFKLLRALVFFAHNLGFT